MNNSQIPFWQIALVGPALFYKAFGEEELSSRFNSLTAQTARDYFILRTLAEVQKYGFAAKRWASEKEQYSSNDHSDMVNMESLLVESAMWQRRLIEALVALINFSTTNKNEYYFHFLSLQDLEHEHHREKDEADFFNINSELTKKRISALKNVVDETRRGLTTNISLWYLKEGRDYDIATFKKRFINAMKIARSAEKTALGYTYLIAFGTASELLHFDITGRQNDPKYAGQDADAFCKALVASIICRAHELCEIEPHGINRAIVTNAHEKRLPSNMLFSRAEVGDFVLINGPHLAEVREIRRSQFGYESYRIKFLDSEHGPGLDEDWLPAPAINIYEKRNEQIKKVRDTLSQYKRNDAEFSEQELLDCTSEAVTEMWKLGLREYFTQQINALKQTDYLKANGKTGERVGEKK